MCAVSNTSLINLMMASRLLYGMAREQVDAAGVRAPCTAAAHAVGGDHVHDRARAALASWSGVRTLGGTTALLLLCVFAIVNVAVLVLRRRPAAHDHYRAPTICPILGLISCSYLASPWSGRDPQQYKIAGVLLAVGAVLFVVNWLVHGRKPLALNPENLTKN